MTKHNSKSTHPNKKAARQPASAQAGFVRIISGQWRGRKLPVQQVEGLRPTTDRIKETLFNWLAADVYQANCLDVFAGSGSLGFEALSRQAAQVTFIELDTSAARQITQNIQTLKAQNAKVMNTNALSYLSQAVNQQALNADETPKPFDLVFIDPPFRKDLIAEVVQQLEHNQWLAEDALIYIETEKELQLPAMPLNWQLMKEKQAGQVCFRLYQRNA